MVTFNACTTWATSPAADAHVVACCEDISLSSEVADHCAAVFQDYESVLEHARFTGKEGQVCSMYGTYNGSLVCLIFVGMGTTKERPLDEVREAYRRALARALRQCEKQRHTHVVVAMPRDLLAADAYMYGRETVITAHMTGYHFDRYITSDDRRCPQRYTISLYAPVNLHDDLCSGADAGQIIGAATTRARMWCDTPAADLTPASLAEQVWHISEQYERLSCRIFDKTDVQKHGMNGVLAVAQGSSQEPRCAVVEYSCGDESAPQVALVGKGVTFDSGGLGIKPARAMDDMKTDMGGAAGVLASMEAIARLRPDVNVVAVVPMVENMTGCAAFKPGDVITHYNGTTSEVMHTDAEGRLILADALSYAADTYNPDAMIDMATLTGACVHALGPFFGGIMSKDMTMVQRAQNAGDTSGDRVWQLPFSEDYKRGLRSEIADVANIASPKYGAGTTTAGLFLSHFVPQQMPWLHIDIAGVSSRVPDRPYYRNGATGFGVRLLVDMIMQW